MENIKTIEDLDLLIREKFEKEQLNFDPERGFYDDSYYAIVEAIWDLINEQKPK